MGVGRSRPFPVYYGSTSGCSDSALLSLWCRALLPPHLPPDVRVPPRDMRAEPEVRGEELSRDFRRAAAASSCRIPPHAVARAPPGVAAALTSPPRLRQRVAGRRRP